MLKPRSSIDTYFGRQVLEVELNQAEGKGKIYFTRPEDYDFPQTCCSSEFGKKILNWFLNICPNMKRIELFLGSEPDDLDTVYLLEDGEWIAPSYIMADYPAYGED